MGNEKESQAGSVASVIIGAIMTYLSYLWVHENVEANKIILILAAPIAIIFLLIGICNLFPKFRGIVLIASGVIVGGGAYWLQTEDIGWNSFYGASMLRCGSIEETLAATVEEKR